MAAAGPTFYPSAWSCLRLAQALRSSCRVPREHKPVTDGHLGRTSGGSVRQLFAPGNVLVDAFHIINPGATSVGSVTTGATASSPTTAQRGSGAVGNSIIDEKRQGLLLKTGGGIGTRTDTADVVATDDTSRRSSALTPSVASLEQVTKPV